MARTGHCRGAAPSARPRHLVQSSPCRPQTGRPAPLPHPEAPLPAAYLRPQVTFSSSSLACRLWASSLSSSSLILCSVKRRKIFSDQGIWESRRPSGKRPCWPYSFLGGQSRTRGHVGTVRGQAPWAARLPDAEEASAGERSGHIASGSPAATAAEARPVLSSLPGPLTSR